jgi:hypothetical protein
MKVLIILGHFALVVGCFALSTAFVSWLWGQTAVVYFGAPIITFWPMDGF